MSHGATRATKLSHDLILTVFICLFLFLVHLRRIFRWILFWDCLGLRGGEIAFLWLLIIFLKWHILYLVTRATMFYTLEKEHDPQILKVYFSVNNLETE